MTDMGLPSNKSALTKIPRLLFAEFIFDTNYPADEIGRRSVVVAEQKSVCLVKALSKKFLYTKEDRSQFVHEYRIDYESLFVGLKTLQV